MTKEEFLVSDFGEKKLIKRIAEKSQKYQNDLYIGDDAALVPYQINRHDKFNFRDSYLVATSDLLIEKYHFPKQMSYFQMGWKVVTVNVSDLAAMGAKPMGILINIAIPSKLKISQFDKILEGILKACSYYNTPLLGGDTNQSNEIIVSGTALGNVEKRNTLRKEGFKKGDLVAITKEVGLAALGFELLKKKNIKKIKKAINNKEISGSLVDLAIKNALEPKARLNEGIYLSNFASSATDITDGLASELHELFDADKAENKHSDLGILIHEDKLFEKPMDKKFRKILEVIDLNFLDIVLHVGEDFEVLFTINSDYIEEIEKNMDFIIIGEINNSNRVEIKHLNGNIVLLSSKGYEHLS